MDWARILACVTGTVDQELLARNEYLATENRILKDQLKGRLMLSHVRDLPFLWLGSCIALCLRCLLPKRRAPGPSRRVHLPLCVRYCCCRVSFSCRPVVLRKGMR
jgi:hypothetical protein